MKLFAALKRQSPARILALGFALVILLGSVLLSLPCSVCGGVELRYIDALYTATSAVCVTGLATVDPGSTFTPLGQGILAALIQIGGMGVASVGAFLIMAVGGRIDLKGRNLLQEAMNMDSGKGLVRFLKNVVTTTFTIEGIGAVLSFFVFVRDYPVPRAIGLSLFHAISAFNNAGFDVLGMGTNLLPYRDDVLMNLITSALIILGGMGFWVIREVLEKRFRWRRLSMHSRVVLSMTAALLLAGTVLFKLTEDMTWLGAFFASVTARTAGFSTYALSGFSLPGLLVLCCLMFIGASSGSTGGGIKTGTFFVLLKGIQASATNCTEKAFHYSVPRSAFRKAAVITLLGICVVLAGCLVTAVLEPELPLEDILVETVSAFATVGLSTGISPTLGTATKLVYMLIMFIGRLGPLTIATLWHFSHGERVRYPEGNIAIG